MRRGKHGSVRVRRALIIMASASGTPVPAIRPGDSPYIAGLGLSYVAMLTAFYVDNGPHLPVWDNLPPLSFWFIPGLVGVPVILRALHRARRDANARASASPGSRE